MLNNYNQNSTGVGYFRNVNHTLNECWVGWRQDYLNPKYRYPFTDLDETLTSIDGDVCSDLVVHQDTFENHFLILETKCYEREPKQHQKRVMRVIDCAMNQSYNLLNLSIPLVTGSGRRIDIRPKWWGYYLLQFEKLCPLDGLMWINGKDIAEHELVELLTFQPSAWGRWK